MSEEFATPRLGAETHPAARVMALTISYNGEPFSGFARQPAQRTVQGELESALETVLRRPVETTGAGRTDAGVHALGQVVSFELQEDENPQPHELLRSLGALCGPHISVAEVREAAPGFSARFSAEAREYRYRIVSGPVAPIFLAPYAWWVKRTLDLSAMREAAESLLGEHDFKSFCVAGSAIGKPTTRRLELVEISTGMDCGEHVGVVRVVGNSFLHSMVRVIVGSLVEVGTGRRPPEWMGEVLAGCDRSLAGPTAPACGLTLWHVSYPEEFWL